jgi:predicted transport protein
MSGNRIPFETHLKRLKEPAKAIMVDLRNFVLSLGGDVIEEVRPHRVAYAKTMNFRTFLDIEPTGDSLVLSIRYGRAAPPATATIRTSEDAENAKKQIAEAYQKIQ